MAQQRDNRLPRTLNTREKQKTSGNVRAKSVTETADIIDSKVAHFPIAARLTRCLYALGQWMVPPHRSVLGEDFAFALANEVGADAAAVFLVPVDERSVLRYAAGSGYRGKYKDVSYFVEQPGKLTSYIARTGESVNLSVMDIDNGTVPCSRVCKDYILKNRFINVCAVPLNFEKTCLGVLKVENKGTDKSKRFPEADFEFLKSIGAVVALAAQLQRYAELWHRGDSIANESRSIKDYLDKLVRVLSQILDAECASAFLLSPDKATLECRAGHGYTDEYLSKKYQLNGDESLTVDVFQRGETDLENAVAIGKRDDVIAQGFRFSGACEKYIGREFRNILAVPIVGKSGSSLGVLKIENKMPNSASFGWHDVSIIREMVSEQIGPKLEWLISRNDKGSKDGMASRILKEHIDPNGKDIQRRVKELERIIGNSEENGSNPPLRLAICEAAREQRKLHNFITVADCTAFAGLFEKKGRMSESMFRRAIDRLDALTANLRAAKSRKAKRK